MPRRRSLGPSGSEIAAQPYPLLAAWICLILALSKTWRVRVGVWHS